MENDKLDRMREQYHEIEVPKEIDEAVQRAILRGRLARKNQSWLPLWTKKACATACACLVLGLGFWGYSSQGRSDPPQIAIGTERESLPLTEATQSAFVDTQVVTMPQEPTPEESSETKPAESAESEPPVVTQEPKREEVVVQKEEEKEEITIPMTSEREGRMVVASLDVDYQEKDLTVILSGENVMEVLDEQALEELKNSDYILDAYQVSAENKIVVLLSEAVQLEVSEDETSARMIMCLTRPVSTETVKVEETTNSTEQIVEPVDWLIYVVRTHSYDSEEDLMEWRRMLAKENPLTVQDEDGNFYLKVGEYSDKREATAKQDEILGRVSDMDIWIEEIFVETEEE